MSDAHRHVVGVVADAEDDGVPPPVVEAVADRLFDLEVADGQGEDEAAAAAQEQPDFIQTFAASGLTE